MYVRVLDADVRVPREPGSAPELVVVTSVRFDASAAWGGDLTPRIRPEGEPGPVQAVHEVFDPRIEEAGSDGT